MRTFADIPAEIERRLAASPRVIVVLLDAFGRRFLDRYGDGHPLLRRLLADGEVQDLATQFPSTTTAHVTTMHTGLPVGAHGLYEWNVYEPLLDAVVTPLRSCFAGDRRSDTLPIDMRELLPDGPTLYERLAAQDVVSSVHQPDTFCPSTFDRAAARGARLRPYATFEAGLREALTELRGAERGYAYVYFDAIDTTGHVCGPSSPEFHDTVRYALDTLETVLFAEHQEVPERTLLLLTADHGQVDVPPRSTLWLDELWPGLHAHLRHRPAGSARDVFLHVDDVAAVVAGLRAAVDGAAEVVAVADLLAAERFGEDPGPRLLDRLGDVCVLPVPDRLAWLRSATDLQARFRGHHGGLAPDESRTYLIAAPLEG